MYGEEKFKIKIKFNKQIFLFIFKSDLIINDYKYTMFLNEIIRKFISFYIGIILGIYFSQECIYLPNMVSV